MDRLALELKKALRDREALLEALRPLVYDLEGRLKRGGRLTNREATLMHQARAAIAAAEGK